MSLVRNFSSNLQFWFFGPNLPRKVFPIKNWKSEHRHWIRHIQIRPGTKSQLKLTILIFLTRFAPKWFFGPKEKKWTPHIFYIILRIQISTKFQFKLAIWFFGRNLSKNWFPVENSKSNYHHGILHIWISLGIKFQLKVIIFSFWTKLTLKRYFSRKQNKQSKDYKCLLFV